MGGSHHESRKIKCPNHESRKLKNGNHENVEILYCTSSKSEPIKISPTKHCLIAMPRNGMYFVFLWNGFGCSTTRIFLIYVVP